MATINDLNNLALGNQFQLGTSGVPQQTIIVQNPVVNPNNCIACDEEVCEVTPSQGVQVDVSRFNRTNPKMRLKFDTTPNPTVDQNIVLFADFASLLGEQSIFPRLADIIIPPFGVSAPFIETQTVFVSGGSDQLFPAPGDTFTQAFVGSSVTSTTPGVYAPGTIVIAVASNGASLTLSTAATGGGPTEPTTFVQDVFAPNDNLINNGPGAAILDEINQTITGGGIIAKMDLQYNATTSPALDGAEITGFHLPLEPTSSAIITIVYTPLCDACTTTGNGNFVTHSYNVGHGVSWRDGIVFFIPGSEEGSVGTLDICWGSIGWSNALQDTWAHQAP